MFFLQLKQLHNDLLLSNHSLRLSYVQLYVFAILYTSLYTGTFFGCCKKNDFKVNFASVQRTTIDSTKRFKGNVPRPFSAERDFDAIMDYSAYTDPDPL